jgi:urease subunit beta
MKPGEYLLNENAGPIQANVGRATATLLVRHTGDRPVQVGSHFHFFEVNPALDFKRETAYGMRLNIPAGTAVRFEPGEEKRVNLVALGGARIVYGHNGKVNGPLDHKGGQG